VRGGERAAARRAWSAMCIPAWLRWWWRRPRR